MNRPRSALGFTLAEALIAMVGTVIIVGALLLGSVSLQKTFHDSDVYARSQADQRRLIDYLARDLRRAVAISTKPTVTATAPGGVTPVAAKAVNGTVTLDNQIDLVLTLPAYYRSDTPSDPNYDQQLGVTTVGDQVTYGTAGGPAPGIPVIFRRSFLASEGSVCFVRFEADQQFVIVRHAEDLDMRLTIAPDGRTCVVEVWFASTYGRSHPLVSTFDQIMLRNIRID